MTFDNFFYKKSTEYSIFFRPFSIPTLNRTANKKTEWNQLLFMYFEVTHIPFFIPHPLSTNALQKGAFLRKFTHKWQKIPSLRTSIKSANQYFSADECWDEYIWMVSDAAVDVRSNQINHRRSETICGEPAAKGPFI